MYQLAQAVKELHSKLVLHRDIKLANILLHMDGTKMHVKLADFGSAIILESRRAKKTFKIGTMGYMAPEMLAGEPFGLPYDVWSLGSLFYCLLTFSLPFWDKDTKKWKKEVMQGKIQIDSPSTIDRVSFEAKDLLMKMLENDPDQRITIDKVLTHPWFRGF